VGIGTEPPVSLFNAREGWWVVEAPPSRRNTRGGVGMGCQSPLSRFSMRGRVGGWLKHPHRVET